MGNSVMKISRDSTGLVDLCFTMLDRVHNDEAIELRDKVKLTSTLIKDVREVVRLELEHKKMLLRAPDLTRNREIALKLGSGGQV